MSGLPIWVVAGPMEPGGADAIATSLKSLSEGDPLRRVGLIPSRHSRKWTFDMGSLDGATVRAPESMLPVVGSAVGVTASLNSILSACPEIRSPVIVIPDGDYVVFRFDHGVADAHALMKMVCRVSHSRFGTDGLPPEPDLPNVLHPMTRAVVHTVRTAPAAFTEAGWSVLRSRAGDLITASRRGSGRRGEQVVHAAEAEPYCAVFVRSTRYFFEGLRRYRAAYHLDISASALVMHALCQSLSDTGIRVLSPVEVLVDLRRYLSAGCSTWSNFQSLSRVGYHPGTTPEAFGADLVAALASARPLVEAVGYVARSRLSGLLTAGRGREEQPPDVAFPEAAASVTLSDISRLPEMAHIRWKQGSAPLFAAALPPASRSHISVLLCSPSEGELQMTATFFPSVFDAGKVEDALTRVIELGADHPIVPDRGAPPSARSGSSRRRPGGRTREQEGFSSMSRHTAE